MISVDTETTGVDLHHGAKPFLVTTCNEAGENSFWEANVNPETREPEWDEEDIDEMAEVLNPHNNPDADDGVVLQNPKFDVKALSNIRPEFGEFWEWGMTKDTLMAGHLLASNQPHDLTTMVLIYLRANIQPLEDAVQSATNEARRIARSKYPHWIIAKEGLPMMPSVKSTNKKKLSRGGESESPWKNDMWLCRAIAKAEGYPVEHRFWTVCADYANGDTATTLPLYKKQEILLKERDLWEIYLERLKLLPIIYAMEKHGITLDRSKLEELRAKYTEESESAGRLCTNIAKTFDYELELPKSAVNNSLRTFCFDSRYLNLPTVKASKKTGNASLDKGAKEEYLSILPEKSKAHLFIKSLGEKSSRDTALSYMESYERFWVNVGENNAETNERLNTRRIERIENIQAENTKDPNLLDLDVGEVRQRLRSISRSRRTQGTQDQLQTIQGTDTRGDISSSHMRQPVVRKSVPLVLRNESGQHERHDRKEERRQGEGDSSWDGKDNRTRSDRNQENSQGSRDPVKGSSNLFVSSVQSKSSSNLRNYQKEILEASSLKDWFILHPSLNATGTDTLRFSSQCPNEQNISKKEGFNLRYMFGPMPGREWWSCDAQNIELRLPAYEASEEAMIQLFERPDDPPYYGSNHLLAFDTLHPEMFAKHGKDVKKIYASTWYQWTKNGNFAVQYGAMKESGTADRAYHVKGAQALIEKRLGKISDLNRRMIDFANRHGYVETIPDKTVNPRRGYPLYCTRSSYGKVLPTVPLSYHVQGTAMWWMMKAMIRCQEYLNEFNASPNSKGYHMIMQVHDELVFDFPKGTGAEPWKTNRPKMRKIQHLMSMGGDDIGVPTPTSCEYHSTSWSIGISV